MGTYLRSLLFLMILVLGFSAQGESIRLFEWTPGNTLAPLIIAVRESEAPSQAAQRYMNGLRNSPDLMELFGGRTPFLPDDKFQEIKNDGRESRVLLIANLPKDYTLESARVENFRNLFALENQKSFILPMVADLGLSGSEGRALQNLINENFSMMVAMGGDDVDPSKYQRTNTHSRNVNPTRDRFEISLIKSYVAAAKGFLLGVCRGAQISSVAMGYKLHQHVPVHIGKDVRHGNDWHDISVMKTQNNLLAPLSGPENKMYVNSLHHQAIIYHEGGPLELAARASDGTTEALEFKNGKGILLQFHPELMGDLLGEKILRAAVKQKQRVRIGSCAHALF